MFSIFRRIRFARNWVRANTSAGDGEFSHVVTIVETKLGGSNSRNIEVLLLAAYCSIKCDRYSLSGEYIDNFFSLVNDSKRHSMMEKVYLAAYATWCEKLVVDELGSSAKYEKYDQLDAISLQHVSARIKRIFPLVIHPDWGERLA